MRKVAIAAVAFALASYALFVTYPALAQTTGSVTLTWTPPTHNTNGTQLTDLAGYKVYWGTVRGSFPNSTTLNTPSLTTYVVQNLAVGQQYFFTMTALNSSGVESARSADVMKALSGVASNPPVIRLRSLAGPVVSVQITDDSMLLPQVGTIAAGKGCSDAQILSMNGTTYYRVNLADITPLPNLYPLAAWAQCQ